MSSLMQRSTSVFACDSVSVCALFAHNQEMSPCKENSQLKLCVFAT